jgi:hypothetical protein
MLVLPSTPIPESPSLLQMVQLLLLLLLLLLHTQPLSTKAASTCCELAADAASASPPIPDSASPLLILRLLHQLSTKAACTCCQREVDPAAVHPHAAATGTAATARTAPPTPQHQGRVHLLSAGGGPAASRIASSTNTATATPSPWNLSELQAFSRNASSRLIASRVILAAGSTGILRLLVRTLERKPLRVLLLLLPFCLSPTKLHCGSQRSFAGRWG